MNRCERCHRSLSNSKDKYGSTCAKILGVSVEGAIRTTNNVDIAKYEESIFKKMSKSDQDRINALKNVWAEAVKREDYRAMNYAHAEASLIRQKYDKSYASKDIYDYTCGGKYPTGKAPKSLGNEHKTIINGVAFTYTLKNGAIAFDLEKNKYTQLINKNGIQKLAEEIYKTAKAQNNNYLSGRTINGIKTEIELHYLAYSVLPDSNSLKENAREVNIGGTVKGRTDYDNNAYFFESANGMKLVGEILLNPYGSIEKLLEISGSRFK